MTIGGGCLCGAVRVEIDAEPIAARACWCRLCQYLGAGSGTVNFVFPADKVRIEGELAYDHRIADSGAPMRRGFCPKCGTPVSSAAETRPHLLILRAGVLDEPGRFAPEMTIWTEAAPGWACIDAELPNWPGPPPAPK